MSTQSATIVQRLWNDCNVLRDDGVLASGEPYQRPIITQPVFMVWPILAQPRAIFYNQVNTNRSVAIMALNVLTRSEVQLHKSKKRPSVPGADSAAEPAGLRAEADVLARLEAAARAGDERAFLAAKDAVDWDAQPAGDFLRAVQLALGAGVHMVARNLAAQGAARHPDSAELQKYARILAPPRVIRAATQPNAGLQANRDWIMAHGAAYHGQWVALRDGQLLAVGTSLDSVIAQVGGTDGKLFTKVY